MAFNDLPIEIRQLIFFQLPISDVLHRVNSPGRSFKEISENKQAFLSSLKSTQMFSIGIYDGKIEKYFSHLYYNTIYGDK